MPVLSKRIVLDCFYLLIFYSEKFSTDVCRLPYAVNVNLNLSISCLPIFETLRFAGGRWRLPCFLFIQVLTSIFAEESSSKLRFDEKESSN